MWATKGEWTGMRGVVLFVLYPSTICFGIFGGKKERLSTTEINGLLRSISWIPFVRFRSLFAKPTFFSSV